jgi:hypothetical protein
VDPEKIAGIADIARNWEPRSDKRFGEQSGEPNGERCIART